MTAVLEMIVLVGKHQLLLMHVVKVVKPILINALLLLLQIPLVVL